MKIVLLEDVEKVGKQYEIKEVADGFAKNFLFPKELAKVATQETIDWANDMRAVGDEKATKELEKAGDIVTELEGLEVEITVKVGDKGQLFEKIDSKDVTEKLKEMGYEITKKQVEMEPIDGLGEFEVKVELKHGLEAQIKVIVSEEQADTKDE